MSVMRHPPAGRAAPLSALMAVGNDRLQAVWPAVRRADLFQSGTAALAAGLRVALESISQGLLRRVALPAYGCPNLVAAAFAAGGEPVYYDVSPDTFAPQPGILATLLAARDCAVVLVDAFGMDCFPTHPPDLSQERLLVHDLAQSYAPYPAAWHPRVPLSVVSFGRAKPLALTTGGALLAAGHGAVRTGVEEIGVGVSSSRCVVRAMLYSASLHPALFGLLSRVPRLGIGQTHFVPLREVARLPANWANKVAAAVLIARRDFELHVEQTAAMLRLAMDSRFLVPQGAVRILDRLPLWRVPLICDTESEANELARAGAHLGVSRLYARSLPEIMGEEPALSREQFPGACSIASRLVTLPTHGRLRTKEMGELKRLLAAVAEASQSPGRTA